LSFAVEINFIAPAFLSSAIVWNVIADLPLKAGSRAAHRLPLLPPPSLFSLVNLLWGTHQGPLILSMFPKENLNKT
jgi:hypothetical protein